MNCYALGVAFTIAIKRGKKYDKDKIKGEIEMRERKQEKKYEKMERKKDGKKMGNKGCRCCFLTLRAFAFTVAGAESHTETAGYIVMHLGCYRNRDKNEARLVSK